MGRSMTKEYRLQEAWGMRGWSYQKERELLRKELETEC